MIMGPRNLKERIRNNEILFTGCIQDCRSGAVIEAYHHAGFDAVMIDREHTALDRGIILELIRTSRLCGISCMIRAAGNTYTEIDPFLDQLPDGIFVPRIRTRADVEKLMETVKFPPRGKRGCGASTCPAGKYLGWEGTVAEMVRELDRTTVVGIQIETKEAIDNLDDILSVDEIDVAVVGNDDLTVGLGIPGQFNSETYRNVVRKVIASCRRHGVMPGIAGGDPAWVNFWAKEGMRFFWSASDTIMIWQGAVDAMKALKPAVEAYR